MAANTSIDILQMELFKVKTRLYFLWPVRLVKIILFFLGASIMAFAFFFLLKEYLMRFKFETIFFALYLGFFLCGGLYAFILDPIGKLIFALFKRFGYDIREYDKLVEDKDYLTGKINRLLHPYKTSSNNFIRRDTKRTDIIKKEASNSKTSIETEIGKEVEFISSVNQTQGRKISSTQYIEDYTSNLELGLLGEEFVIEKEKSLLISNGFPDLANKILHVSKEVGDGLGYDIISYDLKGNKKYIEVKTTEYSDKSSFYISQKEFDQLKTVPNYFLYRVYEFNRQNKSGKYIAFRGIDQLTLGFKIEPCLYRASHM